MVLDLYGTGASISQGNSQTEAARQINLATTDFNNSLAEQLDEARTAEDAAQTDTTSKNMVSVGSSGLKLIGSADARGDVLNAAKKLKTGFKEIPVSFREKMASAAAKTSETPAEIQQSITDDFYRTDAPRPSARPPSPTGLGRRGAAVESTAELGEGAGEEGSRLVGRGFRFGNVESGADVAKSFSERVGVKSLEELGTKGAFKTAVAGVGGVIDVAKDIERGQGLFNKDTYGSNNLQRVGNIGNIVGSALEVAGIATAWTPFGIGLEGVGAAISLASAAAETVGDIDEAEDKKETTEKDIKSQARSMTVAQPVTEAVGRTE